MLLVVIYLWRPRILFDNRFYECCWLFGSAFRSLYVSLDIKARFCLGNFNVLGLHYTFVRNYSDISPIFILAWPVGNIVLCFCWHIATFSRLFSIILLDSFLNYDITLNSFVLKYWLTIFFLLGSSFVVINLRSLSIHFSFLNNIMLCNLPIRMRVIHFLTAIGPWRIVSAILWPIVQVIWWISWIIVMFGRTFWCPCCLLPFCRTIVKVQGWDFLISVHIFYFGFKF